MKKLLQRDYFREVSFFREATLKRSLHRGWSFREGHCTEATLKSYFREATSERSLQRGRSFWEVTFEEVGLFKEATSERPL